MTSEAHDRRDSLRRWTWLLAAAVLGTSALANAPHALGWSAFYPLLPPFQVWDSNQTSHLGGENLQIARAIVSGRGFADPFGEPTGPTAWMPPVLPALLAGLLWLLGGHTVLVAAVVVLLQDLALIYAGSIVLRAASRSAHRAALPAAWAIFMGGTWYHFHSCYLFTHDSWLVMAWVSLLVDAADRLWGRRTTLAGAGLWGLVGGAAALSAPVLGPVWSVLTFLLGVRSHPRRAISLVPPALAATLGVALVLAPWAWRNANRFGRFVPVKSNLYYELYQSNVLEPDGVLRFETGANHPYRSDGAERHQYRDLGEMAYLDGYRFRFRQALADQPGQTLACVGNRLLAATLIYYPFTNTEGGWTLAVSYVLHPLPFYGLLMTVLMPGWTLDRLKWIALAVTASYLAPYIAVAYYERYALPLLGVQALFVFWGWEAICGRFGHAQAEASHVGTTPETSNEELEVNAR